MSSMRHRVSLRESLKIAGKGALQGADYPGGEIVALLATMVFGLWWWIVGVPVRPEGVEGLSDFGVPS
jgi:hypothetical protein